MSWKNTFFSQNPSCCSFDNILERYSSRYFYQDNFGSAFSCYDNETRLFTSPTCIAGLPRVVSQSCHLGERCLVCLFSCRVNTWHPRLRVTLAAAQHNKRRPPLRTTFSRSIKAVWNSSSHRIRSSATEAAVKRTLLSGQLMFCNKRSRIHKNV